MTETVNQPQSRHALENRIPPPFLIPIIGAAMWAVAWLGPVVQAGRNLRLLAAGGFALFGVTVAAIGILSFRKARTTINPVRIDRASSFVTGGIYRYTRNPMYVGLASVLMSWAIYLAVPWAFLGPVVFMVFITRFQIIPEERVMSSKFGRDYDEYRKRVRRWL
jgi:protein-S-isoprenylcysteine O-methyltransferase Ste14